MSKHTISHADKILAGEGVAVNMGDGDHGMGESLPNVQRGIRLGMLVHESIQGGDTDTQAISLNQQPSAGGEQELLINGNEAVDGVANLHRCTLVTITSSANDVGTLFTVLGRDANGRNQAEEITGPNTTTVNGVKTFTKIDRIFVSQDTVGTVSAGESEDNPVGLRRRTMDVEQNFKTLSDLNIPFDAGGGIETAGSFSSGNLTTQTPTTTDQRARYSPVDVTGDIEILYLGDLTKEGVGDNYTDSRQGSSSVI